MASARWRATARTTLICSTLHRSSSILVDRGRTAALSRRRLVRPPPRGGGVPPRAPPPPLTRHRLRLLLRAGIRSRADARRDRGANRRRLVSADALFAPWPPRRRLAGPGAG